MPLLSAWGPALLMLIAVFWLGWKIPNTFRDKIDGLRTDMNAMETRLTDRIGRVESGLGARISKVESGLGARISKVESGLAVLAERIDERTRALRDLVDDRTRATEKRMDKLEVRIDHMVPTAKSPEKEERELMHA